MKKHRPTTPDWPTALLLLLPVGPGSLVAQATQATNNDETVELSPFIVQTNIDRGYEAENTLSGTRLNTPSKSVGAAVTEVTMQLMDDLAAYNIQDVINFTPNASTSFGGGVLDSGGGSGNGAIFGVSYQVRGLAVEGTARDFIQNRVHDDAYNADRISFARGPNSILFGIGDPGGVINFMGTRAQMKNSYNVAFQFDNWDSRRRSFKLNHQIIKNKVALFLAGLDESKETNRKPSDRDAERLTASLTVRPFRKTTFRATAENGRITQLNARPWPVEDGLSKWRAAGSPELPLELRNGGVNFATVAPTAAQNAQKAGLGALMTSLGLQATKLQPGPIIVENGPAMPVLNINGHVSTLLSRRGTDLTGSSTLVDSPIPYTVNVMGYGSAMRQKFQTYTLNLEQVVGENLYLDLAFNRQNTRTHGDSSTGNGSGVNSGTLYIDKNPTVLAMNNQVIPNPNYNRYMIFATTVGNQLRYYDDETLRASLAYTFDFRKRLDGRWGRILGHHSLAVVGERVTNDSVESRAVLKNSTPENFRAGTAQMVVGALTDMRNAQNSVGIIRYIDPSNASTWAAPSYTHAPFMASEDFYFAGMTPPTSAPGAPAGVTPYWAVDNSIRKLNIVRSENFVMQSFFWNERIVPTFGWRKDVLDGRGIPNYIDPARKNFTPNAADIDPYNGSVTNPVDYYKAGGYQKTQGVVVYPIRWMGLSYNQSQNSKPTSGSVDTFSKPLPPVGGEGKDYGIKFSLWGGKINGSVSRFETSQTNATTTALRGGSGVGNMLTSMVAISRAMYNDTSDIKYLDYPWFGLGSVPWNGNYDVVSTGYEFNVTANPTRNWRITANFGQQRAITSNYGKIEQEWLDFAKEHFAARPQYLSRPSGASGLQGPNQTLQQHLDDVATVISLGQSLDGQQNARQSTYSVNFVTGYDFTSGPLKDWGVGASYKWRSKMIIGYALLPGSTTLYDRSRGYFTSDLPNPIGCFASYKFKLPYGIRGKAQANVDGINNDEDLHPYYQVDDGTGRPVTARYFVGSGTTYSLRVNFDF